MTSLLFSFTPISNPLYITSLSCSCVCSLSPLLSTLGFLKSPGYWNSMMNLELTFSLPFDCVCVCVCVCVCRCGKCCYTGWICSIQKSMSWFLGNLHCRTIRYRISWVIVVFLFIFIIGFSSVSFCSLNYLFLSSAYFPPYLLLISLAC